MKKRILSILLAMCMLMSLLPVAAFAAAYEAPTNVTPAILHDTRDANAGGIADEDLVAADSYKVTCEEPASADIGVNHVIKLVATDLKRHRNGDSPENMGYWAGVAIAAPEGATHMKAVAKLSTESLGTAFESAQVREVTPNITADNKGGFVQYLDVSAEAYKAGVFYVKLQWYTDASTAVANSTATVYKVDFSGVKLAPAAIDKVGFCAVGNDANDEVDAIIKSYGRPSGIANRDSDRNTMYIAMTDLDVSGKTYYTVKITDPDGTVLSTNDKNGNKTLSGTIDCRNYTGTENFSVLRITLNPTNRADNGAYVVTTAGDTTPYVMKAGDYKVELYTSATADGELTKIDTETITLNTVTVKDKAGEVADTIFAAKGGTVKAPAAPAADTGYAFKHWSDGTKTYAPEAAVTVTGNITLTPVFERIVAKSVTATADNATLVATPTTDLTADPVTGKITITGAATTPTGDGTTVTLAITPSVGAVETKTFKLKYENETLSADPVQVTIAGINYTIDVSDITLTDLPVKAVETPAPTVKEGVDSDAVSNVTVVANVTGIVNEAVAELQDIATEKKDTAQEIAVYLKVEITNYDDGQSTTPKSVTLDITPVYEAKNTGVAVDPTKAAPLTTTTFETPIEIKVKLPADFVAATTTPVVAKHLNADGSVKEELKATVTKENTDFFATFYATSFSEYTLAVDNRTVTVKFGKNEAVTYTANDVGTALPTAAAETGYTFQGWSGTENATTAEYSGELTFEMLDQMIAASKNAEGVQSTLVLYPVFKKDGGSTSPGSSGGGGSSSSVSVPSASNGKVTVSNNNAKKGDTVTITLTPNTGYVVDTVTVTDSKGNTITVTKTDDTHYTFVMPEGRVTVKATFKQADAPTDGFTDVAADAYYADAVKWAVDKGITNGLTATTFGPNNSCTRGQMVTFLWRAAGSPAATGTNSFSDVASGEYYYDAVLWAVEKGITKGTSATTFSPNATVNRGQTVTFLYRYAESPAVTGDSAFTDVAADAYYADAVKWAVAEEITNGTSATTFAPASNCTRGQIVTFLYRQMAE